MDNLFKQLFKQAKKYLDDRKRLKNLISKASDKSLKLKDKEKRKEFKDDVNSSISLLKDWSKKEYTEIPTKSILSIIAAMIYLVIPTDIIPDFILGTGMLDDAAVISFLLASIKNDIDKYKIFKLNNNNKKSSLENAFVGYETTSVYHKRDDLYLMESLLYYFSKYEFTKESLDVFLKNRAQDLYVRNYYGIKRKEFLVYLATIVTAYSLFNNKKTDEKKKDISDIVSLCYNDAENKNENDMLFIYSSIVSKILTKEKDKSKIFYDHDFSQISFEDDSNFEYGAGRFLKLNEKDVLNNDNDLFNILKQVSFIIYNCNSFLDVKATIDENNQIPTQVKTISLFLNAIYYDVKIEKKETKISKILGLNF